MNPTPRAAVEAIHAELVGVGGLPASQVLDHDPLPGQLNRPQAVTCSIGPVTPEDVNVTVRCYASLSSLEIGAAWDALNDLQAAVEDRLALTDTPRSTWSRPLVLERADGGFDSLVLACDVAVPREDF